MLFQSFFPHEIFEFSAQTKRIWNFSIKQKSYGLQKEIIIIKKDTDSHNLIILHSPTLLLLSRAHWGHTQILDLNFNFQVLLKYSLCQSKNYYPNKLSLSLPYCPRVFKVVHILMWETSDLPSKLNANSILYLGKINPFKQMFSLKWHHFHKNIWFASICNLFPTSPSRMVYLLE